VSATLTAFREDCRAYYAAPRHRPAIAAVLTRVELEYASGQAAETLAYHLNNAA
jgi:hypothetical protein